MLSASAFAALGPVFASHGWVFFGPYRRGQGLSAAAGPYIGDQIAAAQKSGGDFAAAAVMVRLLETDHLDDQLAALAWLRKREFVQPDRIAVAGTSFGGIETVLGAERGSYCAAIDSAGGAQSWADGFEQPYFTGKKGPDRGPQRRILSSDTRRPILALQEVLFGHDSEAMRRMARAAFENAHSHLKMSGN
jgi:dienelactone hydrolase